MKSKSNKNSLWYYCCESSGFYGFKQVFDRKLPDAWVANIWGPFKTFSEAKKDAIEYFKTDILNARDCIGQIKAVKQKDAKPRKGIYVKITT